MLPDKTNQLMVTAVSHTLSEWDSLVGIALKKLKWGLLIQTSARSGAAEKQFSRIYFDTLDKLADRAWNEMKRVLEDTRVKPYDTLENDLASYFSLKLKETFVALKKSAETNAASCYGLPIIPSFDEYYKRLETKLCNEIGIFCAALEARQSEKEINRMSSNINYHLHGNNPRVNIGSKDYSINIANSKIVFDEIRKTIESEIQDENLKRDLQNKVAEMEQSVGNNTFLQKYSEFVALAANHVTVFAPLLPALTQFLTGSSS